MGHVFYDLALRLNNLKKQATITMTWLIRLIRLKTNNVNYKELSLNLINTLNYKSPAIKEKLRIYDLVFNNLQFISFINKKKRRRR